MAIVWWYWLALGLVLIALELAASGGFYIIFFGVAAVLISGLTVIGASGPAWGDTAAPFGRRGGDGKDRRGLPFGLIDMMLLARFRGFDDLLFLPFLRVDRLMLIIEAEGART